MRCESFDDVSSVPLSLVLISDPVVSGSIFYFMCVMPMSCALLLMFLKKVLETPNFHRFIVFD